MDPRVRNAVLGLIAVMAAWWLYGWWTCPPAVEFDNLKYIQQLTSAVSSRDAAWLEKVELVVRERHRNGQMSASELAHFAEIIALAKSGGWKQADRECFAFAEAQLSRKRSRPAGEAHQHHTH